VRRGVYVHACHLDFRLTNRRKYSGHLLAQVFLRILGAAFLRSVSWDGAVTVSRKP
jgi:hypothetical protein